MHFHLALRERLEEDVPMERMGEAIAGADRSVRPDLSATGDDEPSVRQQPIAVRLDLIERPFERRREFLGAELLSHETRSFEQRS